VASLPRVQVGDCDEDIPNGTAALLLAKREMSESLTVLAIDTHRIQPLRYPITTIPRPPFQVRILFVHGGDESTDTISCVVARWYVGDVIGMP